MIYHGTSVNECMREQKFSIRTGSFLSNEKIWGDIWKTTESFPEMVNEIKNIAVTQGGKLTKEILSYLQEICSFPRNSCRHCTSILGALCSKLKL